MGKTMILLTPQKSFTADEAFDHFIKRIVLKNMHNNGCHVNTTVKGKEQEEKCGKAKPKCCSKKKSESDGSPVSRRVVFETKPIHHEDTAEAAKVSLDVAGFTPSSIDVQVDEDRIVSITAERSNRLGDVFKIHRRFHLDKKTADVENIDANITDGVLEVVVRKKTHVGPRVIKISTTTNQDENEEETNSKLRKDSVISTKVEDKEVLENVEDGEEKPVDEVEKVIENKNETSMTAAKGKKEEETNDNENKDWDETFEQI